MNNYKVEKLPKMQKSKFERIMAMCGAPLAIVLVISYMIQDAYSKRRLCSTARG